MTREKIVFGWNYVVENSNKFVDFCNSLWYNILYGK